MNGGADRYFVDTNVLLYSLDPLDPVKQRMARRWMESLWESRSGRISWQVLNEFCANAERKLKVPGSRARSAVEDLVDWEPVGFHLGLLRRAWHWVDQGGVPYWDALIIAAAERAQCRWLLSEDFQHLREYGFVCVLNPFRVEPNGHLP